MKRRLIYFTYSFPFGGIGGGWKTTELEALEKAFDEIVLVPFWREGDDTHAAAAFPKVRLMDPVFSGHPPIRSNLHKLFRSPRVFNYVRELAAKRPYKKKAWRDSWLTSSLFIERMKDHPELRRLLFSKPDAETYLYFFWGVDHTLIIPYLNAAYFKKILVRFHGYDLYEDDPVYKGYLPYRAPMMQKITDALFVSNHGMRWFNERYPNPALRRHLALLGAKPVGESIPSSDGVLRVMSCSWLVPLKRVPLLAEALSALPFPVEWTHMGSGEDEERVKAIVARFPAHVKAVLPGAVKHDRLHEFYDGRPVDLFVNISETEGMPVSIMEALSAGVPVLATNVGGTSEIVGDENGRILPAELQLETLTEAFRWFQGLDEPARAAMRASSARIFHQRLDAHTNAGRLVELILS